MEQSKLHDVELWLAGSILHTNSQRPGAIANISLTECKKATVGSTTKASIRVSKHKTNTTGSARLTVKGALLERLTEYLQHIRPLLPEGPLLFPNARGKPFDHLSRSVKKLGERFGKKLHTATEGRHTAATATAMSCCDEDRDAVATAMSHSWNTQNRYYVERKSREQAEKGFEILECLRRGLTEPKTKKRTPYSPEEDETIKMYIESYRRTGCAECRRVQTASSQPSPGPKPQAGSGQGQAIDQGETCSPGLIIPYCTRLLGCLHLSVICLVYTLNHFIISCS